ncbi:MAG: M23 family metallopeptidase [Solirubrobacterales bacterium]
MPRKTILAALACIAVAAPTGAATFASAGAAREPAFSIELDGEAITRAVSAASRAAAGPVFPLRGDFSWGTAGNAFGGGRGHEGHDLLTSCGAPVVAAMAGRVTENEFEGAAGNLLVVRVKGGENYAYMHLAEPASPKVGERVAAGETVGRVGQTGRASTCHLHFEWWTAPGWYKGGQAVDPAPKLRSWLKR